MGRSQLEGCAAILELEWWSTGVLDEYRTEEFGSYFGVNRDTISCRVKVIGQKPNWDIAINSF